MGGFTETSHIETFKKGESQKGGCKVIKMVDWVPLLQEFIATFIARI